MTYVLSNAKLDVMGHRWITGLANYNFHIHYKSGKSNVEADVLSRIDWEKCDETIQANLIQMIVAAAIVGDVDNHIESVVCGVKTIDSLFPSISDTPAISKAITRSSGQSCLTCLKPISSVMEAVTKPDDSSHPEVTTGPLEDQLNPKCMTKQDWVEGQSKNQTIGKIIHLFKTKELYCRNVNDTDINEMRQIIRQQNRLFMRNGILYRRNEIQEINHPDRNTMHLVLPEAFRKQALQGCNDDLGHLRIEQTLDLLTDCFYWLRMLNDVTRHIKQCERCLKFPVLPEKAPMENIDALFQWN